MANKNKDKLDFWGDSNKSKKSSFSFLGLAKKEKKPAINKINSKSNSNWLNRTLFAPMKKINKPIVAPIFSPGSPSRRFKSSESLLYGRKNIKLYGDRDMDGSPNKFDCSPGKVNKDGFFSNLLHKVTGGRWGQSDEDYSAEKERRKEYSEGLRKVEKKEGTLGMLREAFRIKSGPLSKTTKKEIISEAGKKLKRIKEDIEKDSSKAGWKKEEEFEQAKKEISKETAAKWAAEQKKGTSVSQKMKKFLDTAGEEIVRGTKGFDQPTWKEIAKKYKLPALKPREQQKAAGVVASALATAYPKEILTKDVLSLAKKAQKYPSYAGGKGGKNKQKVVTEASQRGRPVGSVKYYIPGQGPVGVYEYRKYARKVKALRRIQGREAMEGQLQQQLLDQYKQAQFQSQPSNIRSAQVQQVQMQQIPEQLEPTKGFTDAGVYDTTQYQAPIDYSEGNLPPEERMAMKEQQQGYQRATWNQRYQQMLAQREMARRQMLLQQMRQQQLNPKQLAQLQEQKEDLIIHAPQFMKGEMQGSSQNPMTYTSPEQNVLNAPNVNMGQMRNVDQRGEIPAVRLSQKPIPNARGDEYMEINPINGQPVLRKRPSEKWSTNETY